jgi:hypothetical protein
LSDISEEATDLANGEYEDIITSIFPPGQYDPAPNAEVLLAEAKAGTDNPLLLAMLDQIVIPK